MVGVLNMRLTGSITVNGVRVPLDWRIYGTRIEAGAGLPCEDVKVHIDLPNLDNTSGNLVSPIEEIPEVTPLLEPATPYDEMTVTDLRVILQERGLTLGGKKSELIERLIEDDAAPIEESGENGS